MKARAYVLQAPQLPVKIFGMPPTVILPAGSVIMILFFIILMAGFPNVALGLLAVALPTAIGFSVYLGNKDPHVMSVFLAAWRFWGRKPARTLIAGDPNQ
jgi:hypothetical protein